MFKKIFIPLVVLCLFSSIGFARRNARQQVYDLDKVGKLWLYESTNAYLQWDSTNSEIDTPAQWNFSGTVINSGRTQTTVGTSNSALGNSDAITVAAPTEVLVATTAATLASPAISTATATYPAGSRVTLRVSSSTTYGSNNITFSDTDGFDLWGADKTLSLGDEITVELYQLSGGAMEWHLISIKDNAGDIILANEETISNATNGRVDISGDLKVTGNDIVDSGNTTTITMDGSGNVTFASSATVNNDIIMENAETISNNTDGTVEISGVMSSAGIANSGKIIQTNYETNTDSFTITTSTTVAIFYLNKATPLSVTLPAANTWDGATLTFINLAAGDITFSENINGGSYTALYEAGDAVSIHSNNSGWYIMSDYETP